MSAPDSWATKPIIVSGTRALELSLIRLRLLVEEGPDRGVVCELSAPSICIGTGPDNDLRVTDTTTSRKHVAVSLGHGDVLVEDLGSTNGTFIDGIRIRSGHARNGSSIRLGQTIVRVEFGPSQVTIYPSNDDRLGQLLGRSQPMRDLFAFIRQLARTDLPVLVHGETGSGKELVARALHEMGTRGSKPFLVLDCGSIVPDLIRSEIFGHEKGAFTGAQGTTKGILEQAGGGTVFIDEIGEMDMSIQPNLLRALETREICRIGSKQPVAVDFRLVAATHRDLAQRAGEGKFREDLYFRLACVTLEVPPLRERPEDIELLAGTFLARCAERNQVARPEIGPDAVAALEKRPWPGNVRQLRNVIEAACLFATDGRVSAATIEKVLASRGAGGSPALPPGGSRAPVSESLEDAERDVILRALEATGWKKKAAARRLGIAPNTMFAKIRLYGLKPPGEV